MNQGSNPPSHTIALQHEWTNDLHFGRLWNNFEPTSLLSTTGYTNLANLPGFELQNQVSSAARNSQSGGLQFGAPLVGGGYATGRAEYPEAHSSDDLGLEPLLDCLRPVVP